MKDFIWPILIVAGIILLALTGGFKNPSLVQNQTSSTTPSSTQSTVPTPAEHQMTPDEIAAQLQTTQYQADQLKQKIAAEQEAKISSQYKGKISITWGYITTDPNQEYIEIDANYSNTSSINISGWQLVSTSTGQTITIPQGTGLYLANSSNNPENVVLAPGDRAYIITGRSPIYYGFHTNICSGYLSQFNTFSPGLYTSCPQARNEDLSSIPRTINNNNCFDFINSYPTCSISSQTLNNAYSSQCQDFVATKLNYQGCVNTHRNDSNFYSPGSWYVYLNRDQSLWQTQRETVILYDTVGKKVYSITH